MRLISNLELRDDYFRERARRPVARFALRTAARPERLAARADLITRRFTLRAELRAARAGFDLLAFRVALFVFRTSFVAWRFTSVVTELVPPAIAFCAASALAAIAPRVEPIDSATLTSRSWSFDLVDKLGSF